MAAQYTRASGGAKRETHPANPDPAVAWRGEVGRLRRRRCGGIMSLMSTSIEERVTALEHELSELRKLTLAGVQVAPKDAWLETFGWAKDDPHYEEALGLGAEWRARENAAEPHAGS